MARGVTFDGTRCRALTERSRAPPAVSGFRPCLCSGPPLLVLRLKAVGLDSSGMLLQARDRQERLEASGGRGRRRRVRALRVGAAAPGR